MTLVTFWILLAVKCPLESILKLYGRATAMPPAWELTLRRPNLLGIHVPVSPDLAKTVKVKSDHCENLARVLGGAKNGKII